jgi:hypothetical protein
MLPHLSANGIDFATRIVAFATVLVPFLAPLLKKISFRTRSFLKNLPSPQALHRLKKNGSLASF